MLRRAREGKRSRADSAFGLVGTFYFDCTASKIAKVREELKFKQRAVLLTNEVCYASREGGGNRQLRARLLPTSMSNIILGGNNVLERGSLERCVSGLGLKGWKKGKDKEMDENQAKLQEEVKSILSDNYRTDRDLTKWQKQFFMLEAGFLLQSKFLQWTMKTRNEYMWAKPETDENEVVEDSETDEAEVEDEPDANNNGGVGSLINSLSQSQQSAVGPS
jgi:hypothetical protein